MGLRRLFKKPLNWIKYRKDLRNYIEQCADNVQFRYESKNKFPILGEWNEEAGDIDSHYFFQDIWVAQRVFENGITHIYDIGSRIDGYISHLLSMGIEVTMIDVRPLKRKVQGLHFIQENATSLASIANDSLDALSSLHALEHFGLGRYGDTVDYWGWKKALRAMMSKIKTGGCLYLSVPVGCEEKVMFNAHRIFSPLSILRETENEMELTCFTLIHEGEVTECQFDKNDDVHVKINNTCSFMGRYDLGIFVLTKRT